MCCVTGSGGSPTIKNTFFSQQLKILFFRDTVCPLGIIILVCNSSLPEDIGHKRSASVYKLIGWMWSYLISQIRVTNRMLYSEKCANKRWMCLEAILHGVFTHLVSASVPDVFSRIV